MRLKIKFKPLIDRTPGASVVKRGSRYLVIVRKETRLAGWLVRSGEWKQLPKSYLSRIVALKVAASHGNLSGGEGLGK